jgi:hypothetical protein
MPPVPSTKLNDARRRSIESVNRLVPAPRLKLSAFDIFASERRPLLAKQFPHAAHGAPALFGTNKTVGAITFVLKLMWDESSVLDRQPYEACVRDAPHHGHPRSASSERSHTLPK